MNLLWKGHIERKCAGCFIYSYDKFRMLFMMCYFFDSIYENKKIRDCNSYLNGCVSCLALLEGPNTLCPKGVPWKAVACSRSRQTSWRLLSTSSSSRSTTPLCCSISASFSEQLCTTSDSSSTAGKIIVHSLEGLSCVPHITRSSKWYPNNNEFSLTVSDYY